MDTGRGCKMPKGKRVTKPTIALLPTQTEFDEYGFFNWVVLNASHFTCCRKAGPGRMETSKWPCLRQAILAANLLDATQGVKMYKCMVYACTAAGRSVMIAPSQYNEMLALREEA